MREGGRGREARMEGRDEVLVEDQSRLERFQGSALLWGKWELMRFSMVRLVGEVVLASKRLCMSRMTRRSHTKSRTHRRVCKMPCPEAGDRCRIRGIAFQAEHSDAVKAASRP